MSAGGAWFGGLCRVRRTWRLMFWDLVSIFGGKEDHEGVYYLAYARCESVLFNQVDQVDGGFVGQQEDDTRQEKLVIQVIAL